MRTIAVVNQKGGCGKTTTAINLSAFLAEDARRVLLIDLDPQGHATLGLSKGTIQPGKTVYDLFVAENGTRTRVSDVIFSPFEHLDLAPADFLLHAASEKLVSVPGRDQILARALNDVRQHYDYIVIDCPPNVGLLTFNALNAASEVIIPMDPSFFSLHGIAKLLETLSVLERHTGHQLAARVLVTLYAGRTRFVRDVVDEIRGRLCSRHFETIIRYSVKLAEAASHGMPIASYCTRCAGFDDYRAFAAEVMRAETSMASVKDECGKPDVEAGERPSAPVKTTEGVVFTIEAPFARRVQLAGDFNEWTLEGSEMNSAGRIWKTVLKLRPGRYRYRYVVDGRWVTDPMNPEVEPAPYGEDNSVLILREQAVE